MMQTFYCPTKRHYQPKDLVAAADKICSIGFDVSMANISISIYKNNSEKSTDCGSVYIELREIENKENLLLLARFDEKSNQLSTQKSENNINFKDDENISLEEISWFCKIHRKNAVQQYIEKIVLNLKNKDAGSFYVYRHIFKDGRMYIGKGRGIRVKTIEGRNFAYQRALESHGEPFVEKLYQKMSEDSAYELECKLIEEFRDHCGFGFLLNKTGGMEQARVEDMPISTIQTLMHAGKINAAQIECNETVNVFKRYDPEPGSAKMYFKDISFFEAAKLLRCTISDIIEAKKIGCREINGYQILSDKDFEEAVNKR
ncbi:MAG: hypothetical protein K0M68_10220 [Acidovorax sp.]|nr:hypothetical protein [Acidovorax sp.]